MLDKNGQPILEKVCVKTGTILTIDTEAKKLLNGDVELCDISHSFTPQKVEFMRAGGSYAVVWKKVTRFAAKTLGIKTPAVYAVSKQISIENTGLTAVEKIFNKNIVSETPNKFAFWFRC